jgi:hypothetical protein
MNVDSWPLAGQEFQLGPRPAVFGATLVADGEPPVIEVDTRSRSCLQDWKVCGQMLTGRQRAGRLGAAPAKASVDDTHWCSRRGDEPSIISLVRALAGIFSVSGDGRRRR